ERIDPEAVVELGVACGDVPRDTVLEAEPPEQPERARQPFLAVPALVLDGLVHRRHGEPQLLGGQRRGRGGPVHESSRGGCAYGAEVTVGAPRTTDLCRKDAARGVIRRKPDRSCRVSGAR